jgi:misacylated tRNA(Ala) deacylase
MTTRTLYALNSYLTNCQSVVIGTTDEGVFVSETVFYPHGGGQAGDSGRLVTMDGETLAIADTRSIREGEHSGRVLHVAADGQRDLLSRLKEGDRLHVHINWDKRLRHMRLHTASHVAGAILGIETDGCSVTSTHARLDFVTADPIDTDMLNHALQQVVADEKDVTLEVVSADRVAERPELLAALGSGRGDSGEAVRLVRIDDLDWQPCAGTHVRNTREIGGVRVKKVEKKSSRTRRVTLELID